MRHVNLREQEVSNSWGSRAGVEVDFGDIFRQSFVQVHNDAEAQFRYAVTRGDSKIPDCKYRRLDGISPCDGDFSY